MGNVFGRSWEAFYNENILNYFRSLNENPLNIIGLVVDILLVGFLFYCFFRIVKGSRAWQLIKGIIFLIIATWLSGLLNLKILNTRQNHQWSNQVHPLFLSCYRRYYFYRQY